jgi:folate-dependent phosphoribosylglycinamide formyltransferase PurN
MRIGITTFDLENFDFQVQLNSLLRENIEPDFIILHYAGNLNSILKYFRFLKKTISQYRFKSFSFILNRIKEVNNTGGSGFSLTQNEKNEIDAFLKRARVIKADGINDESTINKIRNLENSIIVCNSGILKEEVLRLPKVIFLNAHASKLPLYRGMNNVEWALFENKTIYVTIHKISTVIDEGDILYQEEIDIKNRNLTLIEDYRKYCFFKSNQVMGKAIRKFINNEIAFTEQGKKYEPLLQYYVMHPILKKRLQEKLSGDSGI